MNESLRKTDAGAVTVSESFDPGLIADGAPFPLRKKAQMLMGVTGPFVLGERSTWQSQAELSHKFVCAVCAWVKVCQVCVRESVYECT